MSALYGFIVSMLISATLFIFRSALATALSVVLYCLGFLVISYLFRDGELRFYMFFVSFVTFYFSKKLAFDRVFKILEKLVKFVKKIPLFGKLNNLHPLDKKKEK
jgi:hypothetical protein